ncbi:MAG TPA: hypothetical protein VKB65_08495 [Myxococcota bacterium]|nr:hypothetical protein [Myxococcota bacterium]
MRAASAALAVFAAAVALGLHGYSLPVWHAVIDGSEPSEVLLGEARTVRGDDWNARLPLALAQRAHEPAFPVVNHDAGPGMNMLLPFLLPVAHPTTIFRPSTWGFFLGPDAGLAWMWWSRLLGALGVAWLLFGVLAPGRAALGGLAALALVASPFFQFWSLVPAPTFVLGGLAFLGGLGAAFARRPAAIVGGALLLGWASTGFVLVLYPPFQVSVAAVLGPLFVAVVFEHRAALRLGEHARWRLLGLALAVAVVATALALFWPAAADTVATARHTVYPGQRVATGGGRTLADLLGTNLALPLRVEHWGALQNVCEAAGFWVLSPPLLAVAAWRRLRREARIGAIEVVLAALLVGFALYVTVGVPEWLAAATPLRLLPGRRAVLALGLAEMLLVVRLLGAPRPGGSLALAAAVGLAWGAALAAAAARLAHVFPEFPLPLGLVMAAGNALMAALAVAGAGRRRAWMPAAALAAGSLVVAGWFNPVVRGGSAFLVENPLSRMLVEIDRETGGKSVWLVFNHPVLANLLPVLGLRTLNGIRPLPQLGPWRHLDPQGRRRDLYDRYAAVIFSESPRPGVRIQGLGAAAVQVWLDPGSPVLRRMGVSHVLVQTREPEAFASRTGLRLVGSVGDRHAFALPR